MARYAYFGWWKDQQGAVINAETLTVTLTGTTTAATIYEESSGGSAISGGVITLSSVGYFKFFVDDGDYGAAQHFRLTFTGSKFDTVTLDDIAIIPALITATATEVNTGTESGKAVTPDALAGSYAGTEVVQAVVFDFTTETATGDGKYYFHVPAKLNGMDLVTVHAEVITAGTTGTTDIQIHNLAPAADMLSTVITIDSGETGSDTAAATAVIDTDNDDVATNDVIRIDVDAVSTTAAQGLLVTMEFRLP
jgi:hypothetical protein